MSYRTEQGVQKKDRRGSASQQDPHSLQRPQWMPSPKGNKAASLTVLQRREPAPDTADKSAGGPVTCEFQTNNG